MCHDWILEVLADLESYAWQNDLPGVARKVEEAIAEFRREVAQPDKPTASLLPRPREVN